MEHGKVSQANDFFNPISGRNLPVLNSFTTSLDSFDRFAHINGKQPVCLSFGAPFSNVPLINGLGNLFCLQSFKIEFSVVLKLT